MTSRQQTERRTKQTYRKQKVQGGQQLQNTEATSGDFRSERDKERIFALIEEYETVGFRSFEEVERWQKGFRIPRAVLRFKAN